MVLLIKIRWVRRPVLLIVAASLVLVVGAAAMQGTVRKVRVTSPVLAGDVASLTVDVVPYARCSIALSRGSYTPSSRASLTSKAGRRIMWRWRVPTGAPEGVARATVACGASGALRTTFRILARPTLLPLGEARKRVCARVQLRVQTKYDAELVPLLDRTITQLHADYGTFDCAWGVNADPAAGVFAYYLVSVATGTSPCVFVVSAGVVWPNGGPPAGYSGPVPETYRVTCKTLGA